MKPTDPAASLEQLSKALEREFTTVRTVVPLAGREVEILRPSSAEDLIDEAAFARDERLPYWAELWPSARVLAGQVLRMNGAGRRMLELGCGVGLVAVAAGLAGFDVLSTDYYDDALRFTRRNVWHNTGREGRTKHVDWRRLPPGLGRFDLVVASDVLYERPYAALVANAIARTLEPAGMAVLADPDRMAMNDFLAAADGHGLELQQTTPLPYVDGDIRQTITIYEFRTRLVTADTALMGKGP